MITTLCKDPRVRWNSVRESLKEEISNDFIRSYLNILNGFLWILSWETIADLPIHKFGRKGFTPPINFLIWRFFRIRLTPKKKTDNEIL